MYVERQLHFDGVKPIPKYSHYTIYIFGPSKELLKKSKTDYLKTPILFSGSVMLVRVIGATASIIFGKSN